MDNSPQGDNISEAQFEKLFSDHYEDLCKSTYAIVNDPDTAKDIVQDVFLRIWRQRGNINPGDSFKAYLHRSCINQGLNYIKTYKRKIRREHLYVDRGEGISREPEAERKLIADDLSQRINTCISKLPPACKEVFLLSRYEEMSYKEIAQFLDISVNTVEKHIGKALKALRAVLKDQ